MGIIPKPPRLNGMLSVECLVVVVIEVVDEDFIGLFEIVLDSVVGSSRICGRDAGSGDLMTFLRESSTVFSVSFPLVDFFTGLFWDSKEN